MKWSNFYKRVVIYSQNMIIAVVLVVLFILIVFYMTNSAK